MSIKDRLEQNYNAFWTVHNDDLIVANEFKKLVKMMEENALSGNRYTKVTGDDIPSFIAYRTVYSDINLGKNSMDRILERQKLLNELFRNNELSYTYKNNVMELYWKSENKVFTM